MDFQGKLQLYGKSFTKRCSTPREVLEHLMSKKRRSLVAIAYLFDETLETVRQVVGELKLTEESEDVNG